MVAGTNFAAVMRAALSDEPWAWEVLFRISKPYVLAASQRYFKSDFPNSCRGIIDSDDIACEVWVKAFPLRRFRGRNRVDPDHCNSRDWFRMLRSYVREVVAEQKKRWLHSDRHPGERLTSIDESAGDVPDPLAPDPALSLEIHELIDEFASRFVREDCAFAELLIQGLTASEIVHVLGRNLDWYHKKAGPLRRRWAAHLDRSRSQSAAPTLTRTSLRDERSLETRGKDRPWLSRLLAWIRDRPTPLELDVSVPTEHDCIVCTVFSKPVVVAGEAFLLLVFLHLPDKAEEAALLAREFDDESVRRMFQSLAIGVSRGTLLTFQLAIESSHINEPIQKLAWQGRTESVQFVVSIPRQYRLGPLIGSLTVSLATIPVGHIKFKIRVIGSRPPEPLDDLLPLGDSARRYTQAFVSYASEDRPEVLKRTQMLRSVHIPFFQDQNS